MKKTLLTLSITLISIISFSQNVGIGTNTPDPSAKLEITSTNSGFLPPRMTTAERNAIANPAAGLQIYNITSHCMEIYDFEKWNSVSCVPSVSDIDGQTYPIVEICDQTWMAKNLDVTHYRNGDTIPQVTDPTEWSNLTTGAWCWYNNDSASFAATYGRLYNWYAVNDPRGIAPQGWHVPSDGEWSMLTDCLGGLDVAGGKMKETGTSHWNSPNTGATNSSGFFGLPGGYKYGNLNYFFTIKDGGHWWSNTPYDGYRSWYVSVGNNSAQAIKGYYNWTWGFSVRCVKDNNIPSTLSDGLVAYFPFNGNANDESGNGNNGTVNGATLTTDRFGNSGKAYSFDGMNDYLSTSSSQFCNNINTTICYWVNVKNYTNNGGYLQAQILEEGGNHTYHSQFGPQNSNSYIIAFEFQNVAVISSLSSNDSNFIDNWKHVLLTSKNNTEYDIYLNGIKMPNTTNYPYGNSFCNGNLIWGRETNPLGHHFLDGSLDDIRIYNRALTEAEISYLATH